MKTIDFGNYLLMYYQDRLHEFYENLDKSKSISNEKNIHELRVDIKRLRAIFYFFELLFPNKFISTEYKKNISSLFKSAGKIREIQVNRVCFSRYRIASVVVKQYKLYINAKEKKCKQEFKNAVENFNTELFDKSIKKTENLFKTINNKRIIEVCYLLVKQETKQTKELLHVGKNAAIMHKIRMHMKLLSYVTPLLYEFHPSEELKKTLTLIKKSNTLIGDWHDEMMFISSLEKFAIKSDSLGAEKLISLISIVNKIEKENEFFFDKMKDKINLILKRISKLKK